MRDTIRTLIVDDEPLAVERLQILCARIAYLPLVGTAPEGPGATRLIGSLPPDRVLRHYQMPGLSGLAVAKAVACARPQRGAGDLSGSTRQRPHAHGPELVCCCDCKPGTTAWERPQVGPGASRAGTVATAGGLVVFCDVQDRFMAVDAATGKPLWQFPTNTGWRASPMTYQFDGKQHVAIASGSNIIVFGLVE